MREQDFIRSGGGLVAGVDEAGRGPLAGPVTVGIAIFPTDLFADASRKRWSQPLRSVGDSKELSPAFREVSLEAIKNYACFAVAIHVSNRLIDAWSINRSIEFGIARALSRAHLAGVYPRTLIIDGNYRFSRLEAAFPYIDCHSIIKADRYIFTVSAASIVAKVGRDRRMKKLGRLFPAYGFERHKGYPTRQHRRVIRDIGPSALHRRSYKI